MNQPLLIRIAGGVARVTSGGIKIEVSGGRMARKLNGPTFTGVIDEEDG